MKQQGMLERLYVRHELFLFEFKTNNDNGSK